MKFCPECGRSIEEVDKCVCGFDKTTYKVDSDIHKEYESNNIYFKEDSYNDINKYIFEAAKKMNLDKNITDEDVLDSIEGVRFNTDGCFPKDYIDNINRGNNNE